MLFQVSQKAKELGRRNTCSKLLIVAGVIAALMSSNRSAFATTVEVQGSGQGTALTANFSFDGVAPALSIISTGTDNIGGKFNAHDVDEYSFTGSSCTAPDGSTGTVLVLVRAKAVINYENGQLYSSGSAAADNRGCASKTTGSYGVTETRSVIGGTGKFANASGSWTDVVTGNTLAAPGSPPGMFGLFSGFQYTFSGSVTY